MSSEERDRESSESYEGDGGDREAGKQPFGRRSTKRRSAQGRSAGTHSAKERPPEVEQTPYEVLGVPETASGEQIRKAYLAKVREHPPESAPEAFRRIRKAYGKLKDEAERKRLDLSLFRTEPEWRTDREADQQEAWDFARCYRERIFKILLASSDLYEKDFSRAFRPVDDRIEELK